MDKLRIALLTGEFVEAESLASKLDEHKVYAELCEFYEECRVKRVCLIRPIRNLIIDFVVKYRWQYFSTQDPIKMNLPGRIKLLVDILEERLPEFGRTSDDERVLLLDFLSKTITVFVYTEDKEMRELIPWKELRFMMCILIATKTDRNHIKYPCIDFHFQFLVTDEFICNNLQLLLKALKNNSTENWTDLMEAYKRTYHYYLLIKLLFFFKQLDKPDWNQFVPSSKLLIKVFHVIGESLLKIEDLGYIQQETKEKYKGSFSAFNKMKNDFIAFRLKNKYCTNKLFELHCDDCTDFPPLRILMEILRLNVEITDFLVDEQIAIKRDVVKKWIQEDDLGKLQSKLIAVDTMRVNCWQSFSFVSHANKNIWFIHLVSSITERIMNNNLLTHNLTVKAAFSKLSESLTKMSMNWMRPMSIDEEMVFFLERIKRKNINSLNDIKNDLKLLLNTVIDHGKNIESRSKALLTICDNLFEFQALLPMEIKEEMTFKSFVSKCVFENSMLGILPIINFDIEDGIMEILEKIENYLDEDNEKEKFKQYMNDLLLKREMTKDYKLFSNMDSKITKKIINNFNIKKRNENIESYEDPLQIIEDKLNENCSEYQIIEEFMQKIEFNSREQVLDKARNNNRIRLENMLLETEREFKEHKILDVIELEMFYLKCLQIIESLGMSFHHTENCLDTQCSIPMGKDLRNFIVNGDDYMELFVYDINLIIRSHIEAIFKTGIIDYKFKELPEDEDLTSLRVSFDKQMQWVESALLIKLDQNHLESSLMMTLKSHDCRDRSIIHYSLEECNKDNKFLKYLVYKITQHSKFEANTLFELMITYCETPIIPKFVFNFQCLTLKDGLIDNFLNAESLTEKYNYLLQILCLDCPDMSLFKMLFNWRPIEQMGLFYLACAFDQIHIVKFLMKVPYYKRNINAKVWNDTPLELAVSADRLSMARYLIENGAKVNTFSQKQEIELKSNARWAFVPINVALKNGNLEMIKYLLYKGAELNSHSMDFYTKFSSDFHICEFLVKKYPNLLQCQGHESDNSFLISICLNGNEQIMKYLVEKGANLKARRCCHSVLRAACEGFDSPEIIKYLISKGAPVKVSGQPGPLFTACKYGKEEIVKVLLRNRANPLETVGPLKLSVLGEAIKSQSIPILEELFNRKAIMNEITTMTSFPYIKPETFKYLSSKTNDNWIINTLYLVKDLKLLKVMLAHLMNNQAILSLSNFKETKEPDVLKQVLCYPYLNLSDNSLERIFLDQIMSQNLDIIKMIILKRVKINYADKNMQNKTALHLVCSGPHLFSMDLFKLLISNGANIGAKDIFGKTPIQSLIWMTENQFIRIMRVIIRYGKLNVKVDKDILNKELAK